jgi:dihydrofolate reductase
MPINVIVAMCTNQGIGLRNNMPWNLPKDLKYFRKLTVGNNNNAVIMGKNTWNSAGFLKDRDNLILSNTLQTDDIHNSNVVKSFQTIDRLTKYTSTRNYDNIWVIGGAQIYKQYLENNLVDYIYLTYIDDVYDCDTYFPDIPDNYLSYKFEPYHELTDRGKSTYHLIYKRLQRDMQVEYKNSIWTVVDIHVDVYPHYYFTIRNEEAREIQTVKSKIKLLV